MEITTVYRYSLIGNEAPIASSVGSAFELLHRSGLLPRYINILILVASIHSSVNVLFSTCLALVFRNTIFA